VDEIGIYEGLGSGTLVPIMLKSPPAWNLMSAFTSELMKNKMEAEWRKGQDRSSIASPQLKYHSTAGYVKVSRRTNDQKGCRYESEGEKQNLEVWSRLVIYRAMYCFFSLYLSVLH